MELTSKTSDGSISRQSLWLVTAASFLFATVGCGTNPQKSFDPASAVAIETVAVLVNDVQDKATVSPDFGNDAAFMAGFVGGLIGSLIVGATYSAIMSKQSDAYQKSLAKPMPDMERLAAESLVKKVGKSRLRFEVVRLTGELASKRDITPEELGRLELPNDAFFAGQRLRLWICKQWKGIPTFSHGFGAACTEGLDGSDLHGIYPLT